MTPQSPPPSGLLVILSSPSGAGKSTLARRILSETPQMQFSISATTRDPRQGEEDGREYYFRTVEEFGDMVLKGEMLEHAEVHGNYYGTPKQPVIDAMAAGREVIFDVDWQGGDQIRASDLADFVVSVFILPPSIRELKARLVARAQDDLAVVERRVAQAEVEIRHWTDYDYVLVNDDLETCAAEFSAILEAERLRRIRQPELGAKVSALIGEFSAMANEG